MKITFEIQDRHAVYISIAYENSAIEPPTRSVSIELTPEQIRQIGLRKVGVMDSKDRFEQINKIWLENEAYNDIL